MNNDAYLGNPNLKKVNTPVEFSEHEVKEFQKCATDPLYFMENYVRIVSKTQPKYIITGWWSFDE